MPKDAYEYGVWKTARIQYNYHISVGKIYYSVPHQYIKKDIRLRITQNRIEVFFDHQRICCHRRRYGRPGQYVTIEDHMPPNHRQAGEWNRQRFVNWAKKIGPHTMTVIERLLDKYRVEQQAYNGCLSILKLTDKYTEAELEATCQQALNIIHVPMYKNIKRMIEVKTTSKQAITNTNPVDDQQDHAFLRGWEYYKERD
ncbi:hypothetical protein ACEN33_09610 [Ruoffia sp. FAM 24228]|uniref:Mu transposase domain-containing protein n=1 Tax=Ruoffia sp. FAM 24228 TaxID=3259517 RepID=UPI003884A625